MKAARRYISIGLVAVAALSGCASPTSTPSSGSTTAASATATEKPAPTTVAAQRVGGLKLPDYKGKTLDVAKDELKKAGILTEATAVNGKAVLVARNWTILSHTPAAGTEVEAGSTVTFHVHKPAKESTPAIAPTSSGPAADPTPEAEKTTSRGLRAVSAQVACDMYAEREFRYGYDPHWILGKLAEQILDDQWYLKVEADVTNAYNAEAAVNIECYVGGTDEAPVVESFIWY